MQNRIKQDITRKNKLEQYRTMQNKIEQELKSQDKKGQFKTRQAK